MLTQHRLAHILALSQLRAIILEQHPRCAVDATLLRSRTEVIASRVHCVELIGIRSHTREDFPVVVPPTNDYQSWRTSAFNWFHVTSREVDGTPHLKTVAKEEMLKIVPRLLHSFQFPT